MTGWIQKHDFSAKELGTLLESVALKALYGFDWDSERATTQERETCCPGMGLIADDGTILHIIPLPEGNLIHHHWKREKKYLGLFRNICAINSTGEGISPRTTEGIIHSHFLSAHECTPEMVLEA